MTGRDPRERVDWLAELPAELSSVRQARAAVVGVLRGAGVDSERIDDVELAVSEVAANVVVHARTAFTMTLRFLPGRLRVEIADSSPVNPSDSGILSGDGEAEMGRGLMIVRALTADWGLTPSPGGVGKVVWMEFAD